ncbi:redoxin domain-containing protein [Flavobacterium sp. J49]|uniref:redoxin domain-containing protein n=1 Tax=Flavobacterium sp. J49 TaxID=2718534 RepID=UPI0015946FBD|nr:redoxin domain-containing protein [Flavobacterium sp. J49]MBF6640904.1 redoxin domain-containing protein [Flavobacterium sp. J49]NIC02151.1 redoxin domain-containing protein [Flavobacterium sp. J49]
MKKFLAAFIFYCSSFYATAQTGYEITIDLKNCNDTLAYLTFYRFDKTLIKDTCTTIKNGRIVFNGKNKLDTGIYSLVSQQKTILFDFFIDDDTQKLQLKSEAGSNINKELTALNSDRQNEFFNYLKFLGEQNKAFFEYKQQHVLTTKNDTLALNKKQLELEQNIANYEENFIAKHQGSYIASVLNLKMEKTLKNVPNASNGRPDSTAVYNYYKSNFWRNVDFKDDAVMRNPFLFSKLKTYFDKVVITHPDSVSVEIDRLLLKMKPESLLFKLVLAHLTYTYESSKIMGFDKVFVHLSDKYFKTGKANGIYDDADVVQRIIKRADKLKPLLVGAKAMDLSMIRAEDFHKMKAMGFEDAKNSDEMTKVFYKNINEVNKMWVKLSEVKADYTILVFWDVDCGHCQKEIPVLVKAYNELILEKKNVKVFSVYMQHEGDKYLKYIADNKLPFINVYDGAHYNNAIEKYDVYSTPVIYILDKNKVIKAKRIEAEKVKGIIKTLETTPNP